MKRSSLIILLSIAIVIVSLYITTMAVQLLGLVSLLSFATVFAASEIILTILVMSILYFNSTKSILK